MNTKFLILAFQLISFIGFSSNPTFFSVSNKSLTINFSEFAQSDCNLTIHDAYGKVIFAENNISSKTTKTYNLSNLPIGNYEIVIENDFYINTIPTEISFNKIEINNDFNKVYKPIWDVQNGKISINFLNLKNKSSFSIFDQEGVEVYSENLSNEDSITKTYETANLPQGQYKAVIFQNNKMYSIPFNKA